MKKQTLLYAIIWIVLSSHGQKQIIHTATKANNYCNGNCTTLDIPELNNNPAAIIWVTPILEEGRSINTHAIGVYYTENKWRIFNWDQASMPVGAKFKVEYSTGPDQTRFKYIVTDDLLQKDGSAFIDNPVLNNNPDARFDYLLSWNPAEQRGTNNRNEIKIVYNPDAGKWYISNVNKKALYRGDSYNIILSNDAIVNEKISTTNKAIQIPELITTAVPNSTYGAIASMYMAVWVDGKKLAGDNVLKGHEEQTEIFGFEMGTARPYASGHVSKDRIYEPITIKTHTGIPATIPLFNAFIKNQSIAITIETYTFQSTGGAQVLNYSIKLTDATVISFKQVYQEDGLNKETLATKKYYDEIKIIFKKIEYTSTWKGGLTAEDNGF